MTHSYDVRSSVPIRVYTPSFSRYIREHKVVDAAEATHYSLSGGKFKFTDGDEFLRLYANEHRLNHALFMIEKRTPVFRMHFDIDMVQAEPPSEQDVVQLVNLCTEVFKTFYPGITPKQATKMHLFHCVVLRAPSCPKRGWPGADDVEPPMVTKTGFHFLWPWLQVTQEQALRLRESCVASANNLLGARKTPSNPFYDVIDETVLLQNGLRMLGSDKCEPCGECKNKKQDRDTCTCAGWGYVQQFRPYELYRWVNGTGTLEPGKLKKLMNPEDPLTALQVCSIRCTDDKLVATPGYVVPALAPPCTGVEVLREKAAAQQKRQRKKQCPAAADDRELKDDKSANHILKKGTEIGVNTELVQKVQEFIRGMGPQWGSIQVKQFYMLQNASRYWVKVCGDGASYCTNVNRAHHSSSIYFNIDSTGITQRCYSKKEGVVNVACKSYASPVTPLPQLLLNALFTSPETLRRVESEREALEMPEPPAELIKSMTPDQIAAVKAGQRLALATKRKEALERERLAATSASSTATAHQIALERMKSKVAAPSTSVGSMGGGDFTVQEMKKMRCMEMVKMEKQRKEENDAALKRIRDEAFQGNMSPVVARTPGGAKPKKARTAKGAAASVTSGAA